MTIKKENNEKIKQRIVFEKAVKKEEKGFINFYKLAIGDAKEKRKYEFYLQQCKINEINADKRI